MEDPKHKTPEAAPNGVAPPKVPWPIPWISTEPVPDLPLMHSPTPWPRRGPHVMSNSVWNRLGELLMRCLRWPKQRRATQRTEKERARFWAELREGEREAETRP